MVKSDKRNAKEVSKKCKLVQKEKVDKEDQDHDQDLKMD